jgi:putative oxidoreductase
MRTRPLYDIVALLARTGVGAVFMAHGWQKIQVGITTTSDQFTAMDVPIPTAAAIYATFVELLGGAALILGLLLPIAGVLLFIDMAGAFAFVNGTHGIFLVDEQGVTARNGFELVLVLGVASLVFAAGGAGRLTLDSRLFSRRSSADSDTEAWVASLGSDPDSAKEPRAVAAPAEPERRTPSDVTKPAPSKPAMPATTGGPTVPESAASPRLASDIVTDTSRDTLVAGRRKRRSGKGGDKTQPIRRPGADPKDSPDK